RPASEGPPAGRQALEPILARARPEVLVPRATRRRAGVFRRALRREVSRLRDRRRIAAIAILVVTFALGIAGLIARGEAAGADARAYWAGVRIWLAGGDPFHPTGPFLPYIYPPWMLPLFAPWALLPWDVAWFVWRGGMILGLLWTIDWAYRRRPLPTAIATAVLAFPIAANLDTGNVTLFLALMLWAAQFVEGRLAGFLWAIATWMKWIPAPLWLILPPRGRLWGLVWLAIAAVLSLATLPSTVAQISAIFEFGKRPIRLDYLALLWATIPWLWRHPDPLWWLRPSAWPGIRARLARAVEEWVARWRANPEAAADSARREVGLRVRQFLGLA
ncbi:MAG TPA: glycosyltransferase family 87 protein, partial [Candidatus Limnocylindrales bacterium]|nr:glycosyltransferase family 87 protein [Candidatus Limnocylindrales bacterium]